MYTEIEFPYGNSNYNQTILAAGVKSIFDPNNILNPGVGLLL